MRRNTRGTLIAVNAGLAALLLILTLAPDGAIGQPAQRARGEYTVVGGKIRGGPGNAIWVVDSANQELVALRWNDARNQLEGIDYRDLNADAREQPGR